MVSINVSPCQLVSAITAGAGPSQQVEEAGSRRSSVLGPLSSPVCVVVILSFLPSLPSVYYNNWIPDRKWPSFLSTGVPGLLPRYFPRYGTD